MSYLVKKAQQFNVNFSTQRNDQGILQHKPLTQATNIHPKEAIETLWWTLESMLSSSARKCRKKGLKMDFKKGVL